MRVGEWTRDAVKGKMTDLTAAEVLVVVARPGRRGLQSVFTTMSKPFVRSKIRHTPVKRLSHTPRECNVQRENAWHADT